MYQPQNTHALMVLTMPCLEGKWSQTLQPAKLQYILNLTLSAQPFVMETSQGGCE